MAFTQFESRGPQEHLQTVPGQGKKSGWGFVFPAIYWHPYPPDPCEVGFNSWVYNENIPSKLFTTFVEDQQTWISFLNQAINKINYLHMEGWIWPTLININTEVFGWLITLGLLTRLWSSVGPFPLMHGFHIGEENGDDKAMKKVMAPREKCKLA